MSSLNNQKICVFVLLLALNRFLVKSENCCNGRFPKRFKFGVATSAFQIEGGWNASGKGENIWDRFTHQNPARIADGSNADIADDSYHLYKTDIKLLSYLGVDYYRFSISWSRILPTGYTNKINKDGISYYNNLIDALVANNIAPMVTLYHWDLPQPLQNLGGWTNPLMAQYFKDFAKVAFDNFGDRVKTWITFNEPRLVCVLGYGQPLFAPGVNASGIGDYLCGHTLLKAHALVYHMYNDCYRQKQKGSIGISLESFWAEPASLEKEQQDAAERLLQFYFGWFAHPIFSEQGDYPSIMRNLIDKKSKQQGFDESRLPIFTKTEVDSLRGSADFLGFNHYYTLVVSNVNTTAYPVPSFEDDASVNGTFPTWIADESWGFRKILNWIKNEYNNTKVLVTENGLGTAAGLQDVDRVSFMNNYLKQLLLAICEDSCNVVTYTFWSLMDNFEWISGYLTRYGLFDVNFNSSSRERTPKLSAKHYKQIIKTHQLPVTNTTGNNTYVR